MPPSRSGRADPRSAGYVVPAPDAATRPCPGAAWGGAPRASAVDATVTGPAAITADTPRIADFLAVPTGALVAKGAWMADASASRAADRTLLIQPPPTTAATVARARSPVYLRLPTSPPVRHSPTPQRSTTPEAG